MSPKELLEPSIIETIGDLEVLARDLRAVEIIGVDVESDSFYTYHPKVCLLQFSTADEDIIVDPLAVRDMSPLGDMFRDPAIEKIFHAAEYDLQCLKRDYGFQVRGLFDTMAAARTLGSKELGLAPLILKHFGVKLSKKLQRCDWGQRPLSAEQIDYASRDTHYLLELRDILHKALEEKGLWKDAQDDFTRLEAIKPSEKEFDPDGFWRLAGARDLSPESRAVLKEIYYFREKTASEIDKAPFRVLPEPFMVRLAAALPKDIRSLEKLPGMTPYLFRKFGHDLVQLVAKGLAAEPISRPPERSRPTPWDPATMARYLALREWRKKKAAERGVDSAVILANDDIRALSQAPNGGGEPSSWLSCLRDRKREAYGQDILPILSAPPPAPGKRRRRRRRGAPAA